MLSNPASWRCPCFTKSHVHVDLDTLSAHELWYYFKGGSHELWYYNIVGAHELGTYNKDGSYELLNYKIAGAHELGTYNKVGALELRDYLIEGTVVGGLVNVAYTACSARDWERSGLLEENPQSGCTEIRASLKGPL